MKPYVLALLVGLFPAVAVAQTNPAAQAARAWRQQHERAIVDITVYGPRAELHSGHYGNWARNPALMLAQLLTSMKDDNGRVLVDRFYDGIETLGAAEKRAIADAPDIDAALMKELWLGSTENSPKRLIELIALPSLNIRGMASSRVGDQASNVIPASATATIDMRLVKGMDRRQTEARLLAHVRKQGFFVVDTEPAADVRMSHPKVAKVTVGESRQQPPTFPPTGSSSHET